MFDFLKKSKRGDWNWELGTIILAVAVLVVVGVAVYLIFSGKGVDLFEGIKDFLRIGKA